MLNPIVVYILNHLIQAERGPYALLKNLRLWLHGLHPEVSMAMSCHVCLSAYTSLAVVILTNPKSLANLLYNWLATWGATLILYKVIFLLDKVIFLLDRTQSRFKEVKP